jgi:hypothetical protein
MGKGSRKGGAPVDKILVLEQSLRNKFIEVIKGALTVCPLSRWRLRLFLLPILLRFLGAISRSARHELLGGCGERGGEIWVDWISLRGRRRDVALFREILEVLGGLQIESIVSTRVYRGVK